MHWDTQRDLERHAFIIERGQALIELLATQASASIDEPAPPRKHAIWGSCTGSIRPEAGTSGVN